MNSLDELVEKYIDSVIIHGKKSWDGDPKTANKHFILYTKCYIQICKYGKEGEQVLKTLLNHESHFVRCAAAYHLLPFDSEVGLKMLKKCKNQPDGVGFNAKILLSEWNSGNLMFPVGKEDKILYVTVTNFHRYSK